MSIKHIAAAVITPAAIAGIALSTGAANAATVHHSPAKYHQWVTVKGGDTLSGIAAAHHMSWEALYATPPNKWRVHDPNMLTVGEHLRIPADPSMRAAQFVAPQLPQAVVPSQAPAESATAQAPGEAAPAPVQQPASQAPVQQPASQAPVQQPASQAPAQSSSSGESAFEQCVSWRESGNNPTDPDGLFGILPSTWASLGHSGTAGQASAGEQKAAFNQLYAQDGTAPWQPYDGCS